MSKDDAWILDMVQACRKAREHAEGLDLRRFLQSALHQDAVIRQLTILGEAAKHISAEHRAAHPGVPWKDIAGLRDVVVHAYGKVDLEEVWRIVREDVSPLLAALGAQLPPDEEAR